MEIFLKKVATDLYLKHGENLNRISVVFPNRRAGIFFINYLNDLIKQPLISPRITTINELFHSFSDFFVPDRLNLILRLYKVYRQITSTNESFDDFYYWGGMLVSDFDQIDKYLANAEDLFTNITELKEIDERFKLLGPENKEVLENFWKSVLIENQTPNQEEFVRLWKDLSAIYLQYKAFLRSEQIAYEGMVYRAVVEEILPSEGFHLKDEKYVFIGFNALNRCEEELFRYLLKRGKATFYWDYDEYYLKDPRQEAGLFMRKNLGQFPQTEIALSFDSMTREEKTLKILRAPSQISQAQCAGDEIAGFLKSKESVRFDDTAVVLCDEELLLPSLSALPNEVQTVNITMGFPMKMTPVFNLINLLIDLQKNVKANSGKLTFYFKNVLAILNNQLILSICREDCREKSDFIQTNNLIYLNSTDLNANEIFRLIFTSPQNTLSLMDYFSEIIHTVFKLSPDGEDENSLLTKEYLYQASLAINRLKENILTDQIEISFPTFFRLLIQYLNEQSIPFEGEPIEGIQVMGILETRVLDFQNLVLLSVNDGIMPRISSSGSFIPFNLRKVYGLPTLEEQNAMYAYYFYRLIQRAKNVTFIYHSGSDGLVTGEKSRYLYQLQMESPLDVKEYSVVYKMEQKPKKPILIPKDEKVLTLLKRYFDEKHSLSPTALDKYLTCSLLFYFRHVIGLKEPLEIAEEVDPKIFGLLFHKSMEKLYTPYVGRVLEKNEIQKLCEDCNSVEKIIHEAFLEIYLKGHQKDAEIQYSGKNWLIFEILRKYIFRMLELDLKRAPFSIESLEKKVQAEVLLSDQSRIKLEGFIDRIDRIDETLQILDYKTGKTDLRFPMLVSLFERNSKNRNKAAFQTLVYSLLLHRKYPAQKSIKPGIINLRSFFDENYDPFLKCKETGDQPVDFLKIADAFEKQLIGLLDEIFDSNIPFQKTEVEENCTYCTYRQICL